MPERYRERQENRSIEGAGRRPREKGGWGAGQGGTRKGVRQGMHTLILKTCLKQWEGKQERVVGKGKKWRSREGKHAWHANAHVLFPVRREREGAGSRQAGSVQNPEPNQRRSQKSPGRERRQKSLVPSSPPVNVKWVGWGCL